MTGMCSVTPVSMNTSNNISAVQSPAIPPDRSTWSNSIHRIPDPESLLHLPWKSSAVIHVASRSHKLYLPNCDTKNPQNCVVIDIFLLRDKRKHIYLHVWEWNCNYHYLQMCKTFLDMWKELKLILIWLTLVNVKCHVRFASIM